MSDSDFTPFPKIARLSREVVITEKLDGTNAQIHIERITESFRDEVTEKLVIRAGSRNKWITPEDDNYGFAKWVERNREELITGLGEGTHYGEWWGNGIQRGYGLKEKRFSLFNTHRWSDDNVRPKCCSVVPVLWEGNFNTWAIDRALEQLELYGSQAAPDFMKPEGIVIYHKASGQLFKKTIEKDEEPKNGTKN
jgi:hypothetical protein